MLDDHSAREHRPKALFARRVALLRCLSLPPHRFGEVLRDAAKSNEIREAEPCLSRAVSLFGRLSKPISGFKVVMLNALAAHVHEAEDGLRLWVALLGKRAA
jgi:hypothetical protein